MTVSTIPAVKSQLKTIFKAAVDESTEVWRNRPNEDHQLAENVYIGDVHGTDAIVTIGQRSSQWREEHYSILVEVEVVRDGTDGEGSELRLWEIVGKLETALEADTTIPGLAGVQWSTVSAVDQTAESDNEAWLCRASFQVAVVARI